MAVPSKCSRFALLIAVMLVALTVAARTVKLTEFPSAIHNDESGIAVYVVPTFLGPKAAPAMWGFNGYGGHGNFGNWLLSLPAQVAGESTLLGVRSMAAVCGILSALCFALGLRAAYGGRVALIFLAFVAPFHFHVHFSRTGFQYITAAFTIGLVTWAFGCVVSKPSKKNSAFLGAALGLALNTYSATHILPGALAAGLLALFLSPNYRQAEPHGRLRPFAALLAMATAGFLVTFGAQLWYLIVYGFPNSSRVHSQLWLLHPKPGQEGISIAAIAQTLWMHLEKTLRFFYERDNAAQYGCSRGLLEAWSACLAALGALVLAWRSLRLDPFSIFVISAAVLTLVGSSFMVEGNFSPHLIIFALLAPMACAVGLDTILKLAKVRSQALSAAIVAAAAIPWSMWNYSYLRDVDGRKDSIINWLLHLPIERTEVTNMVNFSSHSTDFKESMYPLMFPKAAYTTEQPTDVPAAIRSFMQAKSCPCVFIINTSASESAAQAVAESGKAAETFSYGKLPAVALFVK